MANPLKDQNTPLYYAKHHGKIIGPFHLEMIEAMALAGQFSANLPICRQGTEEWLPLGMQTQPPPLPNGETANPKKKHEWVWPTIIFLIIAALLVALFIGANTNKQAKKFPSNSYSSPKTTYLSPTPSYTPPKSTYSSPSVSSDSKLYKDAKGRTFSVPNSAYHRLLEKKTELDAKQRSINSTKAEIASSSAELDRLKRTINRTSQYQIDSFNRKVNEYNTKNEQLQIQIDSFNASVDSFNAELERVGTPIR